MTTTQTQTISWPGQSGKEYEYYIYRIGTNFKEAPGNYIFAKETTPNRYAPIYIGETCDLSTRFDNHHKMPCINRNGATHIHVHLSNANADVRRMEEDDLIKKWSPPCND